MKTLFLIVGVASLSYADSSDSFITGFTQGFNQAYYGRQVNSNTQWQAAYEWQFQEQLRIQQQQLEILQQQNWIEQQQLQEERNKNAWWNR